MKTTTLHECQKWAEQTLHQVKDTVKDHEVGRYIIHNPKPAVYAIVTFALTAWVLTKVSIWLGSLALRSIKGPVLARPRTPDLEKPPTSPTSFKAPQRKPGGGYSNLETNDEMLTNCSMDSNGLQTTRCPSSSKLGRPNNKTKSLSSL